MEQEVLSRSRSVLDRIPWHRTEQPAGQLEALRHTFLNPCYFILRSANAK